MCGYLDYAIINNMEILIETKIWDVLDWNQLPRIKEQCV